MQFDMRRQAPDIAQASAEIERSKEVFSVGLSALRCSGHWRILAPYQLSRLIRAPHLCRSRPRRVRRRVVSSAYLGHQHAIDVLSPMVAIATVGMPTRHSAVVSMPRREAEFK